jgi:hypothetical protein
MRDKEMAGRQRETIRRDKEMTGRQRETTGETGG